MMRLFVVADHDIAREGLTSVLDAEADFEVVAGRGYADDLVFELADASPDVLVADHSPPLGDAMRLCRRLREAGIGTRVVLLVDQPTIDMLQEADRAGAHVCLAKYVRSDKLIAAVRAAASDLPDILWDATFWKEDVPALGPSQLGVLRLLVEGKTLAQMAQATGLSQHTVRSHLREIYRRLGASGRAEATAVALRLRLL